MVEATAKHPQVDALLTGLTGKSRVETVAGNRCTTCDDPDMDFRTELDRREYRISGMCQRCQDSVFGSSEEEE